MIRNMLKFQLIRLARFFRSMPVISILMSLILVGAAGWLMYTQSNSLLNSCLIWIFITLILVSYHLHRKDYFFCRILLAANAKWWFILHYLCVLSPCIMISLIRGNYLVAALYLVSSATAFLPKINYRSIDFRLPGFLLPSSIELCGFIRKHRVFLGCSIFLAIIMSFTDAWTLIISVGIALLFSDAYSDAEPREFLLLPELPPPAFLRFKICDGYLLYLKLIAVPLILYACFHIQTAYLLFIPMAVAFIGICFYVCAKYAAYSFPPSSGQNPVLIALGTIGILVIPLLPLTIIMTLIYYFSCKRNLSRYLNVYN